MRLALPLGAMAILSVSPIALMAFVFAVGIPSATALVTQQVKSQSVDVATNMFHGSPPGDPATSHYLVLVNMNWRYMHNTQVTLELTSICRTATLSLYTKYSDDRSQQLDVPFEQMQEEVNGGRTYAMTRYGSRSVDPGKVVGVASRKCFVAVIQDLGGTTYVPDYQVALAAWMGRWTTLRPRDYALIFATNHDCEYPKDNEANPADYCTRVPEAVFADKWNRYNADYSKRIVYMQDLDGFNYALYDLGRNVQRALLYADAHEHGDLLDDYIISKTLFPT